MKREEDYKKGDTVYEVERGEDGMLKLMSVTITDVVITYTPSGRPRKPVYKGKANNFTVDGSDSVVLDPGWYYRSAVKAVSNSMRRYFEMKRSNALMTSPEERLLRAIFGDTEDCQVRPDDIIDVIYDLKNYHDLYMQAFALDNVKVQEVEMEKEAFRDK